MMVEQQLSSLHFSNVGPAANFLSVSEKSFLQSTSAFAAKSTAIKYQKQKKSHQKKVFPLLHIRDWQGLESILAL